MQNRVHKRPALHNVIEYRVILGLPDLFSSLYILISKIYAEGYHTEPSIQVFRLQFGVNAYDT